MSRRNRKGLDDGGLGVKAEINVTSLVDVAFTLLVIFIITAPILQGGVEIEVPKANVEPLSAEDEPFIVAVRRDGTVVLGETEVTLDDFATVFSQLAEAGDVQRAYIKGDSLSYYGPVMQVIAEIAQTGVPFALVAENDWRE